jgi:hypothetical protein
MTKVERHGGQLELGIFRVAHHQSVDREGQKADDVR